MKRIHEGLARALARHRLVFWYDADGEWAEAFDAFPAEGAEKVRVAGDEFAAKVRIARAPDARFLVYVPGPRPADAENWLLDLVLQGHEYRADRVSLILQELGLAEDFREVVDAHLPFFQSQKRVEALRAQLAPRDEPGDVRLRMMAVLAGAPADADALLLHFLGRAADSEGDDPLAPVDPVAEAFGHARLVEPFWKAVARTFAYDPAPLAAPSVRDLAVTLFRGASPLDRAVTLNAHARVFLQRWKDSQQHRASYVAWAGRLQEELQVAGQLGQFGPRSGLAPLGEADTFELFERFTLQRLARAFHDGVAGGELRAAIQQRRGSAWWRAHAAGYEALEQAVALRELLDGIELGVESVDAGVRRYLSHWWRVDAAYRRCIHALRRYAQPGVMEAVRDWVERHYVHDFLQPLADRWSDRVQGMTRWSSDALPLQRRFWEQWVLPFRTRGQRLFVIVSDALRYEAAEELAVRLRQANRWTAEVEAAFGALPSFTQLGMASLLPGSAWALDRDGNASVDGHPATGSENRRQILAAACDGRAAVVKAGRFLEMNSKTEGRELARDHDVVFVYHDCIDAAGDDLESEGKTFDAVAEALDELEQLVRKVAAVNGTNILVTADHGFLFQQDPVDEGDMQYLPPAAEWLVTKRRFALGRGVSAAPGVKTFEAASLGLDGDWTAAFPLGLGRFPLRGSGKRYVHGGPSLQEIVVPVVRVHKARADDTGQVEVEVLRLPARVSTGQLAVALFQDRPALGKVRPRTLRVGLFAKDGTLLSDQRTVPMDSGEAEARLREVPVTLLLSSAADAHNGRDVELRLEEQLAGTAQWVTYRSYDLKLQKRFDTDDFDL